MLFLSIEVLLYILLRHAIIYIGFQENTT